MKNGPGPREEVLNLGKSELCEGKRQRSACVFGVGFLIYCLFKIEV